MNNTKNQTHTLLPEIAELYKRGGGVFDKKNISAMLPSSCADIFPTNYVTTYHDTSITGITEP